MTVPTALPRQRSGTGPPAPPFAATVIAPTAAVQSPPVHGVTRDGGLPPVHGVTRDGGVPATGSGPRHQARTGGISAALTGLMATLPPGAPVGGPAGYAVVPIAFVRGAPDGPARPALDALGLAVVRTPAVGPVPAAFATGLLRLRLGLSEGLLDVALAYLGSRRSADQPLISYQMIKGALAEAVIEHLQIGAMLAGDASDLPVGDTAYLHAQITATDRLLLRLLGASGFTVAGAGGTAYASELLAAAYTGEPSTPPTAPGGRTGNEELQ